MTQLAEKILALLEQNRGDYLSGERIAEQLSVSRAAVWKSIAQLREEGHQIKALNRLGYCLDSQSDVLTESGVRAALAPAWKHVPICVYQTVDSTNCVAKAAASHGAPHGSIILADEQTAGRGRRGRRFFSPAGTGVYMSVLLRPQEKEIDVAHLTMIAAVAVCRALHRVAGISAQIKWINDIFWKERKICGILSEATFALESGQVESVVVGIGINLTTRDFPLELQSIAGSVENGKNIPRVAVIAAVLNELFSIVQSGEDIFAEYSSRVFIIGKQIRYTERDAEKTGIALRIDPDGALVVSDANEGEKRLHSADISIMIKAEGNGADSENLCK